MVAGEVVAVEEAEVEEAVEAVAEEAGAEEAGAAEAGAADSVDRAFWKTTKILSSSLHHNRPEILRARHVRTCCP